MSAIYVAQVPRPVVILGKEQGGVGAFRRILVKQTIGQLQEALWLIECDSTLAAQIRLQVGHQERGRDSFSRNIAHYQPKPILTEIKEIVIITAHLACLDTSSRVIERANRWKRLRKEPGLHLLGN